MILSRRNVIKRWKKFFRSLYINPFNGANEGSRGTRYVYVAEGSDNVAYEIPMEYGIA